ncbi:MAG: RIP metalloprotease [Desulfovibrio sp.]|nr:RIP metalloprotease [Desulfovibrio sp.]
MNSIIGTVSVILVFGGLIFFHELGHFLSARLLGMGVQTFSLGFGPALFSFKRKKTKYQVAALPLGGFVSLVGETAKADIPEGFSETESFSLRPAGQRFLVIASGPAFNLILAWLICWGLIFAQGRSFIPPLVGEIIADSPAASSPLRAGDRILSLDGTSVRRWQDMPPLVSRAAGNNIVVSAQRPDGAMLVFSLSPALLKHQSRDGKSIESWGMGIRAAGEQENEQFGLFASAWEGLVDAANMVVYTWNSLTDIISSRVAFDNVGGPVLIAQTIYKQADYGAASVLMLAALISVNLGLLNLLPVPVLDGGHLLFLLAEMLTRRRVPERVQEKAMLAGMAALLCLIVAATFNDIMR